MLSRADARSESSLSTTNRALAGRVPAPVEAPADAPDYHPEKDLADQAIE